MKKLLILALFLSLLCPVWPSVTATMTWVLDDSSQFTYDSASITVGLTGASLTNIITPGLTFYAALATSTTADYGLGTKTATASGATIVGGKLDCTGNKVKYAYWSGTSNQPGAQTGAIRFLYTPNYSGAPPTTKCLVDIDKATQNNQIILNHVVTTGQLYLGIKNSSAVAIMAASLGVWTPVSGTEYEFEIDYDITAGSTRLFVNGVQFGTTQTQTGTRSTDVTFLILGSRYDLTSISNGYFRKFTCFSTVQHTAAYTAGVAVVTKTYSTDNPSIQPLRSILAASLLYFTASSTQTSPDAVKYDFLVNSVPYYISAGVWTIGSGSYLHSNPASEILGSITTLPFTLSSYVYPRAWIHSATGTGTPCLHNFSLQYIAGNTNRPGLCRIRGYVSYGDTIPIPSVTVSAVPERDAWVSATGIIVLAEKVTTTSDADGYFYLDLIRSSTYERTIKYKVTITINNRIALSRVITVPSQSAANLEDLVR